MIKNSNDFQSYFHSDFSLFMKRIHPPNEMKAVRLESGIQKIGRLCKRMKSLPNVSFSASGEFSSMILQKGVILFNGFLSGSITFKSSLCDNSQEYAARYRTSVICWIFFREIFSHLLLCLILSAMELNLYFAPSLFSPRAFRKSFKYKSIDSSMSIKRWANSLIKALAIKGLSEKITLVPPAPSDSKTPLSVKVQKHTVLNKPYSST